MSMNRICVFSGSNWGTKIEYRHAAAALGQFVAQSGIVLVYGGTANGLMGAAADAALAAGGKVIGVVPRPIAELDRVHDRLSEIKVVDTLHQRMQVMADLSDAFIALPGGLGTLEELFEVWTWAQLGTSRKPVGVLDVENYYSKLLEFLDKAVMEGFVKSEHRSMVLVDTKPAALLDRLFSFTPSVVSKRIPQKQI